MSILCTLFIAAVYYSMADAKQVVVVGGGLAGLSATIEAALAGANVTLLEKEANVGGNSAKASSGINGCGTKVQRRMNIEDNKDKCFSDTLTAGDNFNNRDLVDQLVEHSVGAVEWLTDIGVNLDDVNLCGGHSVARTHWIPSPKEGKPIPVGVEIIRKLRAHVDKLIDDGKPITVINGANVEELIFEGVDNQYKIAGVRARLPAFSGQLTDVVADAVILASGGFAGDQGDAEDSLMKENAPDKLKYSTTNGAFAKGEGMKMARNIGARLIDLDQVQVHPTAFIDPKAPDASTKFLAAEALRGKGAILLNELGARFCDELGRRDYVTEQINEHCRAHDDIGGRHAAYMLMDEESVDSFGRPAFTFYHKIKGFFTQYNTVEGLIADTGFDRTELKNALAAYAKAKAGEQEDAFGKTRFPVAFTHIVDAMSGKGEMQPVYVARITPANHYTMGGVEIDARARVISQNGQFIPGLYAAGEVTGGVHGHNRLAGNSLLECVVFGRIAGQEQSD